MKQALPLAQTLRMWLPRPRVTRNRSPVQAVASHGARTSLGRTPRQGRDRPRGQGRAAPCDPPSPDLGSFLPRAQAPAETRFGTTGAAAPVSPFAEAGAVRGGGGSPDPCGAVAQDQGAARRVRPVSRRTRRGPAGPANPALLPSPIRGHEAPRLPAAACAAGGKGGPFLAKGGALAGEGLGGHPGGPDRSTRETIWSSKGQPIESFPSAPGVPATVGRVLPGRPRPRQTLAHREPALTRLVGRKRRACGSVQGNPCRRQTRCERSLAPCFSPRARRVCALSPPRGR